jgi:AraC-like DNA-binding protein
VKSDHHRTFRRFADTERLAGYYSYEHDPYRPPLQVVSSGSARWGPGRTFSRRDSALFGVELVTGGEAFLVQDGREYGIRAGEVYILRTRCAHVYGTGRAGLLHKRYLTLAGPALEHLLHTSGLAGRDYIRPLAPRRVASLMRTANGLMRHKPEGFTLCLSGLAYELLLELGRSTTPQYPSPLRVAIEFMQQHLDRPVRGEEISARTGLSRTHFNRLFRRHLGTSPMSYFIAQRMAWAAHLLSATALSVKEIAAAIGYDDPLYFSARFKKHTGVSPREYRHEARSGKPATRPRENP